MSENGANKQNLSIEDLLQEERKFPPTKEFQAQANINDESIYEKAAQDPEAYWANWAKELKWFKPWNQVLDWKPPHAKWFLGGKLNASVNCLDRHVENGLGNKTAILWEGETGDTCTLTYQQLLDEVCRFSNVLKNLGIQKGDRIAVYMPMTPEIIIACLASARVGAVHSVVFGGFSAEALSDRIQDASAKLVITEDFGWRRGKKVLLKKAVDEAVANCPTIENVVMVQRDKKVVLDESECAFKQGRDHWWHELMAEADSVCEPEVMDAEDMLFTLYTSGTTGKPKGIVHTTGGYMTGVYATTKWVFDMKPEDVYWCTADVGWITGHSYIIYGPLSNAATIVVYEGAPDWPEKDRFWQIVEKYKVTIFYTAPTAIRAFMKWGEEWPQKADLSSLRLLGSVGEPINPEAWMWYQEHIGRNNCPVVDTWWQTETGSILITPLPGLTTTKPGSATKPFPGISAEVLNEKGEKVEAGGGYVCVTRPWPSMLRTIFNDDKRYQETYWSKWKNDIYFPGDGVKKDSEGYFWFLGRVDDVMNIAGHRIGTAEVESALVDHEAVAESAVVGKKHDIKGEAIVAFVIVREGIEPSDDLVKELKQHVSQKIGAIARPEDILFSADLPKTRSGKIMRRLLRDVADGKALGDTTTLADPTVVESLRKKYEAVED